MIYLQSSFFEKYAIINLLLVIIFVIGSKGLDSVECDPSSKSRTGRARLLATIPCDLSRQTYCNLPGSSYPWNAVKRFVYENQGLVRRMYGDLHQLFLIKSDIDDSENENEISFDYQLKHSVDKYSRSFNTHVNQRRQRTANVNERATKQEKPHFKSKPTKPSSNSNTVEQSENLTVFDNLIKDILDSNTLSSKTTKLTSVTPASEKVKVKLNTSDENGNEIKVKAPENIDKYVIETFGNNSILSSTMAPTTEKPVEVSSTPKDDSLLEGEVAAPNNDDDDEEAEEAIITEIFSLNDEIKQGTEKTKNTNKKNSMETQLFQDTFQKDQKEPPVNFGKRGVNACGVKEEVIAPFWGNNTRGEVLALLNIYPFEQYINWEKCTHEFEQMYCRDGCRCEQQFRLHRLLAYNPYDPCRGIFSDWFRFPNSCNCRCYDVPFDYRVTSRSPRSQNIDVDVVPAELIFTEDNPDIFGPP